MAVIIAWRSGKVEVASKEQEHAATLVRGPRKKLEMLLLTLARHAKDGETLLVPGVPEAANAMQAVGALCIFQTALEQRLQNGRTGA